MAPQPPSPNNVIALPPSHHHSIPRGHAAAVSAQGTARCPRESRPSLASDPTCLAPAWRGGGERGRRRQAGRTQRPFALERAVQRCPMTKDCGGTSSRASGLVRYLIFDLSFDLGTVRRHVGRCECNSSASTCPCPSPSGMHTSTTHASDPRSLRAKKRAAGPAERPSPPLCVRPFSAFARSSPRAARNVDVLGAADGTVGGILRESMLLSEPFLRRPFGSSLALSCAPPSHSTRVFSMPPQCPAMDAAAPREGDRILLLREHWLRLRLSGGKDDEARGARLACGGA